MSASRFVAGQEVLPGLVLTEEQAEKLAALKGLYEHWNAQINVISRKDMEAFEVHHVLHSLGIAAVQRFLPGSRVLDIGTGGGFPGIPLAILHPETQFVLCDSIGKKIKVVRAVAESLGLKNVLAIHGRAESLRIPPVDFVVSRAVTRLAGFMPFATPHLSKVSRHDKPNGVLYLKGGDLAEELAEVQDSFQIHRFPLGPVWPEEPFFETKQVITVN
jgi:16S rRNA (guanine527-N7)-methyltransferase